jgi:hypothetical protein
MFGDNDIMWIGKEFFQIWNWAFDAYRLYTLWIFFSENGFASYSSSFGFVFISPFSCCRVFVVYPFKNSLGTSSCFSCFSRFSFIYLILATMEDELFSLKAWRREQ